MLCFHTRWATFQQASGIQNRQSLILRPRCALHFQNFFFFEKGKLFFLLRNKQKNVLLAPSRMHLPEKHPTTKEESERKPDQYWRPQRYLWCSISLRYFEVKPSLSSLSYVWSLTQRFILPWKGRRIPGCYLVETLSILVGRTSLFAIVGDKGWLGRNA